MVPLTIEDRVAAGVSYVSKQYGVRWYGVIRLDLLDLSRYEFCILGQLDRSGVNLIHPGFKGFGWNMSWSEAANLGFYEPQDYRGLNQEWTRVIQKLRAAEEGQQS